MAGAGRSRGIPEVEIPVLRLELCKGKAQACEDDYMIKKGQRGEGGSWRIMMV